MQKKKQKNKKHNNNQNNSISTAFTRIKTFFSFKNPDFPYLLGVVLLATIAGWFLLLPGYFIMHDDLQMMRQLVMETCLKDGQIPCRWTQYMGYGYGFPLFNYYPQLPYLVGEIYRVVGFSFVDTAKLTFFTSFVASGLTMYLFAREFWGRLGGLLSSAFYIWAPYHSVDIYVRGAMNESWALIWFPLILWSSYKLILESKPRYIVILALGFFGLLNSHNLMALIFSPLFAFWCLMWAFKVGLRFKTVVQLGISGIWALGLSAFFTLPVVFEQKYVHVETLVAGYYDYVAHFVTLRQLLITRFWGYGPSIWGDNDGMPFQVGHLHWILSLILLVLVVWRFIKYRRLDNFSLISLFFVSTGWFAVFMTHNQSTQIWISLNEFLKFVQFPWRFLTLAILSFSAAIGGFVFIAGEKYPKYKTLGTLLLIAILVILNKAYFSPEHGKLGPLTDSEKFNAAAWDIQQTAGIYDYLPTGAKTAPKSPQKTVAQLSNGDGELTNMSQKSNYAHVTANVQSDNAILQVNIFQYPGWEVSVDGSKVDTFIDRDEWGRMHINLTKGTHEVVAKFVNTPIRTEANIISLFSWVAVIIPLLSKKFAKVLG